VDTFFLGIETSCDETAVAIVSSSRGVLANTIRSQIEEHTPFGGVVPNIAARAHGAYIDTLVRQTVATAAIAPAKITAIAATTGPGLVGGLLVGASYAKGLAIGLSKPFYAVNHLQGHALSVRLVADVPFPYLMLLVSGGHSQLCVVEGVTTFYPLGSSLDDAAGEAFDKVAKMLGLGFPGGVAVEKAARDGNPDAVLLPEPLLTKKGYDFSFSGLKNAVRLAVMAAPPLNEATKADIAASFQRTAAHHLARRTERAAVFAKTGWPALSALAVVGGVAANQTVRSALEDVSSRQGLRLIFPPPVLCTDNAAMIAWAALERYQTGDAGDTLETVCRPRWPLTAL
jgi:N6-L-threonylcarbamoyladenine synthase